MKVGLIRMKWINKTTKTFKKTSTQKGQLRLRTEINNGPSQTSKESNV